MSAPLAVTSATAASLPVANATGLPVVNEAREPAAVREGSPAVKKAYATAQGFEEMLLQQLSQSLVQSSGLGGEGESEGSGEAGTSSAGAEGGSGMLASLLPQTLTEGVMRQGGIGLSTQLMRELDPAAASSTTASSTTASPVTASPVTAGPTGGAAAVGAAAPTGGTAA
jgi:Rod binding domain-containing protein